jgi:oligopeptide transport system substrate-binding protein
MKSSRLGVRVVIVFVVSAALAACTGISADTEYFGRVQPPEGQVMRYISGSEPESLDPPVSSGQPEARLYMALFDGLTDYDPKTSAPIPGVAESWEANGDNSEFVFHLRQNARWSNGEPVTAGDFVYSWRRALSPSLASRNAYLAYDIKYAQAYNEGQVFVGNTETGDFVLEAGSSEQLPSDTVNEETADRTPFREYITGATRLTLPGDEASRESLFEENPELRDRVDGLELVPIQGEDIGIEAVDDYTFRVTLVRPAPYFVGLVAHQTFKPVLKWLVEQYGEAWTRPENIVTNGPFKLESWKPYNELVMVRDPMYWDAEAVRLDKLIFYPMEDATTMMNLYKAGEVDAVYNHVVPVAWLDLIRPLRDYMDAPENAIGYYMFNVTRAPMDDVRVRKAFNAAIDKAALAKFRRVTKPLTAFTPEGIYPGYPQPRGDPFDADRAKQLLAEVGYVDADGNYDPDAFPIGEVELTYNTSEANRQVAEFVQAQWRQNLGLTVPLKNMEWKTFLVTRAELDYKGVGRAGWVGDYMDPYSFLNLFYTKGGDNGTGWWDPEFVRLLDEANRTLDPTIRYELLAQAEAYMLEAQPVIPLDTAATNWMKKPYVKGMYPNPGTLHSWKFVYIEHDPDKWDHGIPDMTN